MKTLLTMLFAGCLSANVVLADIDAALDNPNRPERERAIDERRKPAEVLDFFGIKAGMSVFDVFAGGGYYTEILSYVVGPDGKVVHYNNAPWAAFVNKATEQRFKDNRLDNVERLIAPPESLQGRSAEFDAAIFILGMHDIYYADPATGWVAIDKDKFLEGIFDLLKPGAVLGIVDHNGEPGSNPADVGQRLHRIDPAILIKDLEQIGFVLEAESNILANADDDKTTNVFLEQNRLRTDRCVLRFRKPFEKPKA